MTFKNTLCTAALALATCTLSLAQKVSFKPDPQLLKTISADYKDGVSQYKVMMKGLEADKFPKSYYPKTGKFETSNSGWWCSGFYPGTLLYLYKATGDKTMLTEANRMLEALAKEQYNKTTHDLGFMMYCSLATRKS